ncbi:type II toxin-antitoxin system PemK/MazF family toxin [Paenibacillus amylolyticus]|uniref:type II toxin-antitoxin system PemK/MazF family toxin n=1 Tax=Paenibacillus amylolyticus TaxID=1451 RepID=UPI0032421491
MIKRGDLFMINYGDGEGSEQQGYRPGLVIQNDVGNEFSPTVIVVAITDGEDKRLLPTHFPIGIKEGMRKASVVMFEQIRTIDKNRLDYRFGSIAPELMVQMEHPLMISLGLKAAPTPRRKSVNK